ncbi:polysaccharide deacetylase family protein [Kitasatospora sp. NBC_00240]|uniref:polysaccharide deacetylase family protein n=1 Tax=Kitasatospora sp. NBC_00240 TaxID=2903567 RepID=UPI002254CC2D|nr:polysaccharide deacetylase family protein [Kitasatospora sp. NBC_00240]MCX5213921.1 polysaccharide deacetylase family protein [Kitasatospora sp. NBC_00240]
MRGRRAGPCSDLDFENRPESFDPTARPATVALTFDDGPHPDSTPALLAALAAGGRPATFFVRGDQAERHPGLVRAIHRAGFEIGNHSFSHPYLTGLRPAGIEAEIERTQRTVARLTGTRPALFRPPYGETNPMVRAAATAAGLTEVLWTVDTRDWAGADPAAIAGAVAAARPGDIVLLHDAGGRNTVDALPLVLAALARRGLRPGPLATGA